MYTHLSVDLEILPPSYDIKKAARTIRPSP